MTVTLALDYSITNWSFELFPSFVWHMRRLLVPIVCAISQYLVLVVVEPAAVRDLVSCRFVGGIEFRAKVMAQLRIYFLMTLSLPHTLSYSYGCVDTQQMQSSEWYSSTRCYRDNFKWVWALFKVYLDIVILNMLRELLAKSATQIGNQAVLFRQRWTPKFWLNICIFKFAGTYGDGYSSFVVLSCMKSDCDIGRRVNKIMLMSFWVWPEGGCNNRHCIIRHALPLKGLFLILHICKTLASTDVLPTMYRYLKLVRVVSIVKFGLKILDIGVAPYSSSVWISICMFFRIATRITGFSRLNRNLIYPEHNSTL